MKIGYWTSSSSVRTTSLAPTRTISLQEPIRQCLQVSNVSPSRRNKWATIESSLRLQLSVIKTISNPSNMTYRDWLTMINASTPSTSTSLSGKEYILILLPSRLLELFLGLLEFVYLFGGLSHTSASENSRTTSRITRNFNSKAGEVVSARLQKAKTSPRNNLNCRAMRNLLTNPSRSRCLNNSFMISNDLWI